MPLPSFWKWKLLELRKLGNGLLIHPQSQSKWKSVWRLGTITLMALAHRRPADFQTHQVRRSACTVYSSNWPMRVKWAPFCNFTGPFFKKGGTKSKYTECFLRPLTFYMGRTRRTLCSHFGTFWPTEKASARIILQNPGCLSGEIMTQKKKSPEKKGNCYGKRL